MYHSQLDCLLVHSAVQDIRGNCRSNSWIAFTFLDKCTDEVWTSRWRKRNDFWRWQLRGACTPSSTATRSCRFPLTAPASASSREPSTMGLWCEGLPVQQETRGLHWNSNDDFVGDVIFEYVLFRSTYTCMNTCLTPYVQRMHWSNFQKHSQMNYLFTDQNETYLARSGNDAVCFTRSAERTESRKQSGRVSELVGRTMRAYARCSTWKSANMFWRSRAWIHNRLTRGCRSWTRQQ